MIKQTQISVAPMMDWTNRHCRFFHRFISPNTVLYTEMVTTGAIQHGDAPRFLGFDPAEHPVVLQLGGSDPAALAECAAIGDEYGYDEINLNCGCPSDRVQSGRFGACLMTEPEIVAEGVAAMSNVTDKPVTVKCRIGIDDEDSFEFLDRFVGTIADKGCQTFVIHARKAWLSGLSPKQNREVPPLNYERVVAIKEQYPQLNIVLNGGLTQISQIKDYIDALDGFMIGREAYQNPYFLAQIEQQIFGNSQVPSREDAARAMISYAEKQAQDHGTPIKSITRHILGLFHQQSGAKAWKRTLSTLPYEDGAGPEVIEKALAAQKQAAAALRTQI